MLFSASQPLPPTVARFLLCSKSLGTCAVFGKLESLCKDVYSYVEGSPKRHDRFKAVQRVLAKHDQSKELNVLQVGYRQGCWHTTCCAACACLLCTGQQLFR